METREPLRVLIVDDSRIFRGQLELVLGEFPDVEIIGSVFSGEKALEFIEKTPPDLVTLDVQMPGIGGLETLRRIVARNQKQKQLPPIDTILVSALTRGGSIVAVEGLQLGAFDCICKPGEGDELINRDALRRAMREQIAALRLRRNDLRYRSLTATVSAGTFAPEKSRKKFSAIAIGASTGGPEALGILLPELLQRAAEPAAPIFIVQHILEGLSGYLADSLTRKCGRAVREVRDETPVLPGGIYLAQSGRHMLLRSTAGRLVLGHSDAPLEKGCRPSVDVFLRSAAACYGTSLATVILTGMGDDGADGIRSVKRAGGYVIAQDESTSVVWGMPRAAAATGLVDDVLPLSRIAETLQRLVGAGSR
jgi:two-component system chemotaxis response regulator CheB